MIYKIYSSFFLLILVTIALCAINPAFAVNQEKAKPKTAPLANRFMIRQILQEVNENFFRSRSMQLDIVKKQMRITPLLAQWVYKEWYPSDPSLSTKKLIQSWNTHSNGDRIPLTFFVVKNAIPIGTVSLKQQLDPAFADYPKHSIWMGNLLVRLEERSQGIGQELLNFALTIAKQLNYKEMYFYTSTPTNVKWYLKRGARIIEERPFRNHRITIMSIVL